MDVRVNDSLDGFMASIRRQIEDKWQTAGEIAEAGAQQGARKAQALTRSRPGKKTRKPGRVEFGDMADAIRFRRVSSTLSQIRAQYGFVDAYDDYMVYQTVTGFTHYLSGEYIAPTFALRDSIPATDSYVRRLAKGNL